jgi:peptidoglycan/xylan/chitin deacetylase (PgdA/CDA1 family)
MKIKNTVLDVAIKLLDAMRLTSADFSNKGLLTILSFHRILPQRMRAEYPLPGLVITPEEFRWIISTLVEFYDCGSVSEVMFRWKNNQKQKKSLLALTFDDGQEDNYQYAVPVLKEFGIKATFYIPAAIVDQRGFLWHDILGFTVLREYGNGSLIYRLNEILGIDLTSCRSMIDAARTAVSRAKILDHQHRIELITNCTDRLNCPDWAGLMTWQQLREMADDGHEIGSHSMTHPIITKCSDSELEYEIAESRKLIQDRLGTPITSFCYPNGDFNERAEAVVKNAGYTSAVTTRWKANRTGGSRFHLGRCDINAARLRNSQGELSSSMLSWRLSSLKRKFENTEDKNYFSIVVESLFSK